MEDCQLLQLLSYLNLIYHKSDCHTTKLQQNFLATESDRRASALQLVNGFSMKQKHMWLKSKQRCSHPESRGCGWGMLKQNIHFRTWQSLAIRDSAVWGRSHPKTFAKASCIKMCFYVTRVSSSQWRLKQDGNKWTWMHLEEISASCSMPVKVQQICSTGLAVHGQ